jgi:hypothetical protein
MGALHMGGVKTGSKRIDFVIIYLAVHTYMDVHMHTMV